jgi:hypothetical protein
MILSFRCFKFASSAGLLRRISCAVAYVAIRSTNGSFKYVLEKSQGQIVNEKKLRNIAAKIKQGESQSAAAKEMQELAITGIEKAKPLLKDVIKLLLDEYLQTIKDITDEAIIDTLNEEIQKIIKEKI